MSLQVLIPAQRCAERRDDDPVLMHADGGRPAFGRELCVQQPFDLPARDGDRQGHDMLLPVGDGPEFAVGADRRQQEREHILKLLHLTRAEVDRPLPVL